MIEKIKTIRVNLSKIELNASNSKNSNINLFTEHARINLLLGRNWLGKALKHAGTPYPYEKDENRKSIVDIKPAVDVSASKEEVDIMSIEQISATRKQLEDVLIELGEQFGKQNVDKSIDMSKMYLSNVRMLLGNILGVMHDVNQVQEQIDEIEGKKTTTKKDEEDLIFLKKKLEILGQVVEEE